MSNVARIIRMKNSNGQIQLLLILVVIGVAILLSGGLSVKKNIRTQQGGNVENVLPIPTLPAQETFTSTGTCCDRGDGAACQVVDSDCFNFRGSEYCRLKSNTTFMEDWGWLDRTEATHKGNPVYVNLTEEVNTCAPTVEEGSWIPDGQDELYVGGCTKVPNDIMAYVCTNDCPIISKMQLPTGQWIPDSATGGQNAVYDVYFKKNEQIPSFISFCSKTFSPIVLLPKDKIDRFQDLFKKKVDQKIQEEPTPTPTIAPNVTQQSSRKSLQIDFLELQKKEVQKKVEEVKKEIEKTLAPWFSPYCKPAIYLYPKEKTHVSVQIAPKGKLTLTIPKYPSNGWNVVAYPDGRINYKNSSYEYLYYEAEIPDGKIPEQKEGFVVAHTDLPKTLDNLLPQLGLNEKEANEFKNYWIRALPRFPYYYIGVVPKSTLDRIAPLAIVPTPDNIIRVTLYFKALDTKIGVRPPKITTPERSGFTVVEWGGIVKTDKNHNFSCLM